ncbi:tripartite tricarboxylate transporter substrate binding protein [Rhodoferax sediminis]|uniref:Tripartite tricarboxylate transporter substrate binding protein n=1 Tax=Rhodoferax sediminis TaxID=2509614 RepID=A0A515DDN2_9BURK|nr:tripartite tricarboxylate transporter substrate binding protein [Rhodoferax sediminis]QDL38495.1 tripartite tricarboxylate transporter substrate binding protein [Rhodoferax sediminis]
MQKRNLLAALGALAVLATQPAMAQQAYPSRPIRLIVPYAAGGGTDTAARAMSQKLGELLGQPVIVEDKPGASTQIGTNYVVRAAPDGYTLLMGTANLATNVALFAHLPYNVQTDLEPVSLITKVPVFIFANAKSPIKSVADLVAQSQSASGGLSFASAGTGSIPHLAGELFKTESKSHLQHIPYKGSSEAAAALIGGQVPVSFDTLGPNFAQVKSGALIALAIAMPTRSSLLPNVPTLKELGYPMEAYSWWGVLAPRGTPAPIVAQLNKEIQTVLQTPKVRELLLQQGIEPVGSTPAEFSAHIQTETARWTNVAQRAGIKPQ